MNSSINIIRQKLVKTNVTVFEVIYQFHTPAVLPPSPTGYAAMETNLGPTDIRVWTPPPGLPDRSILLRHLLQAGFRLV
jgi:hypothetical protein